MRIIVVFSSYLVVKYTCIKDLAMWHSYYPCTDHILESEVFSAVVT